MPLEKNLCSEITSIFIYMYALRPLLRLFPHHQYLLQSGLLSLVDRILIESCTSTWDTVVTDSLGSQSKFPAQFILLLIVLIAVGP